MSLFVVTKINKEEYGMDIEKVQSIEKITKITKVPKTPNYIKGVINLRGEIIPVISLRAKLGMDDIIYDDSTRIVVIKNDDILIGFIVDSANEVIELTDNDVEDISNEEKNINKNTDYISKIGKKDDRLLLILDLDKLISQDVKK